MHKTIKQFFNFQGWPHQFIPEVGPSRYAAGLLLGFPIDYEGQTISLWPVFADEYHIICRGKTSEELWLLSRTPSHPA